MEFCDGFRHIFTRLLLWSRAVQVVRARAGQGFQTKLFAFLRRFLVSAAPAHQLASISSTQGNILFFLNQQNGDFCSFSKVSSSVVAKFLFVFKSTLAAQQPNPSLYKQSCHLLFDLNWNLPFGQQAENLPFHFLPLCFPTNPGSPPESPRCCSLAWKSPVLRSMEYFLGSQPDPEGVSACASSPGTLFPLQSQCQLATLPSPGHGMG